jgi:hypothetical protein
MLFLLACAAPDVETGEGEAPRELPGHNECLPAGEEMSAEVCLAVVEESGRYPTESEDKAGADAALDAERLADPDLAWVTEQVNRCACRCCHTAAWGGAGVYFWDLDFQPVWTNSASLWSLGVFAGLTREVDQTLPTDDLERVQAWLDRERGRRSGRDG